MTKNNLKDLLFDMINEHDGMFRDIELNDSLDSIIVETTEKERSIIQINELINNHTA